MENFMNAVFQMENILLFVSLGGIIWTITSVFKFKGFIISTSVLLLFFAIFEYAGKFIQYAFINKPILFLIFILALAILAIVSTICTLKKQTKSYFNNNRYSKEQQKKYIKKEFKLAIKQLAIVIAASSILAGIILIFVIRSSG